MDADVLRRGMTIISEKPEKWDTDFHDYLMVISSGKKWLEGTLGKTLLKWLHTVYVQTDKNTMGYEVSCSLNTKEAAEKAHSFLLSSALPVQFQVGKN